MKKTLLLTTLLTIASSLAFAQNNKVSHPDYITSSRAYETVPLREIAPITEKEWQQLVNEAEEKQLHKKKKQRNYPFSNTALPKGSDPVWQQDAPTSRGANAPIQVFDGNPSAGWPTDVTGSVNSSHYVQTTNTLYSIYNKTGTKLVGPNNINSLFTSVPGGMCSDVDPVTLYDEQADRWLIAEFSWCASSYYLLVAISQTGDPTGAWYSYSFLANGFPDYPKFGVWQDGYYIGVNKGNSSITGQDDIYVLERDSMLVGQTARAVAFENLERANANFMLASPVDNDGAFAPTGTPGLFVCINDDAWNYIHDQIWIYELDVDWATTSNSTFQRVQAINVAAFDSNFGMSRQNIQQAGSSTKIDALPEPVMNRPQYRNFGSHQTIMLSHNVDANGSDLAGMRWYELRKTNGDWEVRQQGTYAPDGHSRWMGSIAINENNRIALGYSISSSSLHPGIRYAAQSPSAYSSANGTLDVAEEIILTGGYSQNGQDRWGDYTNIACDPSNDSIFWYTAQYISSSGGRETKIASFKFGPSPLNADFVASNRNPEINTTVQLTDLSYGSPTSWQWSFSPTTVTYVDGTNSNSQNPKVQFTTLGNYDVTLIATKGGTNDTETKLAHIVVTPNCTVSSFPWTEDFENSGSIPTCWDQEYVNYLNRDWVFGAGNGGSNPSSAHSGSYNAYLKDGSITSGKTMLITPELDLSGLTTAQMDFWHTQDLYFSAQDELKVFYKTTASSSWTQIAYYTNQISSWQHDSLSLPNPSSTYFIAFEGNVLSGNGVCIDDVTVKQGPSCPFPIYQQTTNTASNTVDLNWIEGGSATEWEIEWGSTGFSQGTGTTVTSISSNPYTLGGLVPQTTYDWYVRARCSPVSASAWTGPNTFTTTEQTYSLPVIEDFEGGMVKFDNKTGNTVNWAINTTLKHGGSQSVKNSYSSNNINILHETGVMDLSSAVMPALTFWHIGETESGYDFCYVEVSTDGGSNYSVIPASAYQGSASNYATTTRFDESSYTEWSVGNTPDNTWWKKETFSLDAYNSTTVKIRFKLVSDGSIERDGWYLDDISVEVPTCPPPGSVTTSNITHNSAQLNWTEQGSATSWDIEYGASGFTQGNGTMITGTTINPYPLTSLSASTAYDWYVRSSCGGGDYSTWVGPTTFSTSCVAASIPYLEDFENATKPSMPSCMAMENTNSDNRMWKSSDSYDGQLSGNLSAEIGASVSLPANDWMFTNGLQLSAGVEYEVGFGYKASGGFADEKLEVKWGNAQTSTAMTMGTIWQKTGFTNTDFVLGHGTFTPTTSGVYYVGIHAFSDANKYGIFVDDIYVVKTSGNAVWTGTTDNNWWASTNWGNDTLPGSQTNVEIPSGLTNYPTLTNIGPCNNFTIKSGANSDGSIIDNARLLPQGQTTIERYLTAGKWHLVSSPVSNTTVNSLYFNGNPDVWLKKYNEPTDDWTYITSLTTSMPFGGGFAVWVETGNDTVANFIGDIKKDELWLDSWSTPPITYTNATHGFNLVGNPYPSSLDWDNSGWYRTGIEGSVWVWNQATTNYVFRNLSNQGSLTDGIIPMGQGFFIRANDINNNFGITPSVRVHSNQAYYKSGRTRGNIPYIVIKGTNNDLGDEAWVSLDDEATEDYDDGRDVRKMFSDFGAPQIYFGHNTDSLSILAIPMLYNDTRVVDLNYKAGENGSQKLTLDQTHMMWDTDIYLEDLFLNGIVDFKQNTEYTFNASVTDDANRFKVHFLNIVTSTNHNDMGEGVTVYSNDGSIYIVNEKCNDPVADIWVFDLLGRKAANARTGNRVYRIDNLTINQYYIVKVLCNNSVATEKVYLK